MGVDDDALTAAEAELAWRFLWDFPDFLFSDFDPGCLTFTPRINCKKQNLTIINYFVGKTKILMLLARSFAYIFATLDIWVDDYEISFLKAICPHKIS